MELEFITAGQIVNTHGIRGEIKILPQDVDAEILHKIKTIYIDGEQRAVTASRVHKGCLLAKLPGVDDMDAALALKNKTVAIRRKDAKLPTKKSIGSAPKYVKLNTIQPTARPGIAAGVNSASTHSASLTRNWIAHVDESGSIKFCICVSTAYTAAITPPWAR